MALPHTIIELMDKAQLSPKERELYGNRVGRLLQAIRERAYREGHDAGYAIGMDDCFNALDSIDAVDDDDIKNLPMQDEHENIP